MVIIKQIHKNYRLDIFGHVRWLFAPVALHNVTFNGGTIHRDDSMSSAFMRGEPERKWCWWMKKSEEHSNPIVYKKIRRTDFVTMWLIKPKLETFLISFKEKYSFFE